MEVIALHSSLELKLEALHRCFEFGKDVKSASNEIGYSRASIYIRRRKYLQKEAVALMTPADDPRGELVAGAPVAAAEISKLKSQIADLQMPVDVLTETLQVLKRPRRQPDNSPESGSTNKSISRRV